MLKTRARLVSAFIFAVDLAITGAAFFLAYALRNGLLPRWWPGALPYGLYPLRNYAPLLVLILPVWAAMFAGFRIYRSHRTFTLLEELGQVAKVTLAGGGSLLALLYLLKWHQVSRPFLLLFLLLSTLLLAAEKLSIRLLARWTRARGFNFRNLLIVGNGARALELARLIRQHPYWGFRIVGFVSDGHQTDVDTLGEIEAIPRILQSHVVDDVIFVVSRRKMEELEEAFAHCQELGINTRVALNIFPRINSRMHLDQIEGIPLLTFTRIPTNVTALAVKRGLDIVLSTVLLVLLAPVMALIALLIRFDSRGPALFRQVRCGVNGRRFMLRKFRTMFEDAEERKESVRHLNVMDGPAFKAKDDPRITRIGSFLRKFSLDELPQLWNVLKGEMSLVGPRPPIPEEVARYQRWQKRRLSMRPGLTCIWQISGRSKLDFETWMKLDLDYIDTWSMKLDFLILLKTIPAVISGRGAH